MMKDVLTESLSGHSRWSDLQTVKDVMKVLDTPFYLMSKQGGDTFVVGGLLEFTAEEVNYVGVGMGMAHFGPSLFLLHRRLRSSPARSYPASFRPCTPVPGSRRFRWKWAPFRPVATIR